MTQTKAELLQTRHQGDIRLGDADSTHYVGFKAPATVSSSLVWTLPAADGTANYLLKTDGSGNLGWVADSTTDSTKMPLAGGTFTGNVTSNDNVEARFGTGADLKIYHDGTDNYWQTGATTTHFRINNGNRLTLKSDGNVQMQGSSGKNFEWKTTGILSLADDAKVVFGTGNDAEIYHSSSDNRTYIRETGSGAMCLQGDYIKLQKVDGSEDMAVFQNDGAVELYHNGIKTFETQSTGIQITAPEAGSAHIYMYGDEGDDNADKWRIEAQNASTAGSFRIASYQTGSWVDTLTIDGSGNIGINETSPNFSEFGSNGGGLELDDVNTGFTAVKVSQSSTHLYLVAHSSGAYLSTRSNQALVFETNSTTALTLSASQNATFAGAINTSDNKNINIGNGGDLKFRSNGSKGIVEGSISQVATAVSALDLNLNTSNYFTKTISGNSTFTFSNPAPSGTVTAFTLELTHSSGTVTWPASVKWNADTAPTLTTGKTHLFMFVTDDGGTRYRGSALVDYVN